MNEVIVKRIQAGENVSENIGSLYRENIGLIRKAAASFRVKRSDIEDLEQSGFIGLVNAAKKWDPDRGASFVTYAYIMIRKEMQRYLYQSGTVIRLPEYRIRRVMKYQSLTEQYQREHGKKPAPEELAELLGVTLRILEEIRIDAEVFRIRSTSEPIKIGDDEMELESLIPDPSDPISEIDQKIESEELNAVLWNIVDGLPDREPDVIRKRYQGELSVKECAADMGITPAEVSSLHNKALNQMRAWKIRKRLEEFYEPDNLASISLRHVTRSAFIRDRISSTEKAVLLGDEIRNDE